MVNTVSCFTFLFPPRPLSASIPRIFSLSNPKKFQMNWFYVENSQQKGPVLEEELAALVQNGTIKIDTLVWREGLPDWQPLVRLRPDLAAATGSPMLSGTAVPEQSKDLLVQQMREGILTEVAAPGAMRYVGFWWRFLAAFIDGIIVGVAQQIIQFVIMMILGVGMAGVDPKDSSGGTALLGAFAMIVMVTLSFGLNAAYYTWMVTRYQATLGKLALGFKVVTADGGRVTTMRALGRWAANALLNTIILYIVLLIPVGLVFALGLGGMGGLDKLKDNPAMVGWIFALFGAGAVGFGVGAFPWWMAGMDPEKRALHDRICATRVIRK